MLNPKFKPNRKNGYNPPKCRDERLRYIQIKCGKCLECRKQKKREWLTRLSEELKNNPEKAWFLTLTIDPESMKSLSEKYKLKDANEIATKAHRLYLELIRRHTKKSIKHWSITELGEEKGRIHLHGIFWGNIETIKSNWKYGFVFVGQYVNEKTINYITKYMLKENPADKNFIGKILCSKGIGKDYTENLNARLINKYNGKETKEYYLLQNGQKTALPDYYKRKIWTDEQREQLRLYKEELPYTWVMGEKVHGQIEENNLKNFYRKLSKEITKFDYDEEQRRKKRKKEKELHNICNKGMKDYINKVKKKLKERDKCCMEAEQSLDFHITGYYEP